MVCIQSSNKWQQWSSIDTPSILYFVHFSSQNLVFGSDSKYLEHILLNRITQTVLLFYFMGKKGKQYLSACKPVLWFFEQPFEYHLDLQDIFICSALCTNLYCTAHLAFKQSQSPATTWSCLNDNALCEMVRATQFSYRKQIS